MASAPTLPETETKSIGGGFLLGEVSPEDCFTPEDFTEEQRQIEQAADEFVEHEILPVVGELEEKKPALLRELLNKSAEVGLLAVLTPEEYGGLEMDVTTNMIVAERCGRYASFSSTWGGHVSIGTMPLLYFGTHEQKQRYLPRLATAEIAAAYCLSEPQAGSDALAARTRADFSPDGRHYILNGEKMWITNGGLADFYTVFAKVGGEKFTAFLVERAWDGVKPGAEEHKMGIRGSSTTPIVFEDVKVPVENVLGEVGRGHIIAFNVLNLGRLKLGVACVGGGKDVLAESTRYAKQRKAFGHAIADFGMIQHKLAEMAIRLYATESLCYRTAGLIDGQLAGEGLTGNAKAAAELKAAEEFAVECSIAKVYSSEALDYMVDEAVQIHGGYGFHQDYMVERAYRDSRINRIFEGTNEINRLLVTGMLVKRAARGRLPLMGAVQAAMTNWGGEPASSRTGSGPLAQERALISRLKTATLIAAGAAYMRYGKGLEEEQEVVAAISDCVFEIFAAESAVLRTEKMQAKGRGQQALLMSRVLVSDAAELVRRHAAGALVACSEGEELDAHLEGVRKLTSCRPVNAIQLRRKIAARLIEADRFVV